MGNCSSDTSKRHLVAQNQQPISRHAQSSADTARRPDEKEGDERDQAAKLMQATYRGNAARKECRQRQAVRARAAGQDEAESTNTPKSEAVLPASAQDSALIERSATIVQAHVRGRAARKQGYASDIDLHTHSNSVTPLDDNTSGNMGSGEGSEDVGFPAEPTSVTPSSSIGAKPSSRHSWSRRSSRGATPVSTRRSSRGATPASTRRSARSATPASSRRSSRGATPTPVARRSCGTTAATADGTAAADELAPTDKSEPAPSDDYAATDGSVGEWRHAEDKFNAPSAEPAAAMHDVQGPDAASRAGPADAMGAGVFSCKDAPAKAGLLWEAAKPKLAEWWAQLSTQASRARFWGGS